MSAPSLHLPTGALSLDCVLVVGILNRTPDSFYDRGQYQNLEIAVNRARAMVEEGADIIDIGGEKAGPGVPVSIEEEIARVVPTIEALRGQLRVPLSVDTFKPAVARAAVEAGAEIINSIGGFRDPAMRRVAAETGAGVVIMHIQGNPRVANPHPRYSNVVEEVREFLVSQANACREDGVSPDSIIIDPGPGFGKTTEHDLAVIRGVGRLTETRFPVMLAVSRKKVIGDVLDLEVEERLEGSLALTVWGVLQGVRFVRCHDVRATARVCRMTEAVLHPTTVEEAS